MLKALFSILGVVALTAAFLLSTTQANPVEIGTDAPKVKAVDQDGKTVDFGEVYKKNLTLVYFYPKADTPGCTKEACSLRDAFAKLAEKGITVLGVSMDKPEAQKAFKEKYNLPFTLIADEGGKVVNAFGVPVNRLSFPSRQSFLIDKSGKIVWRDLNASTDQQAADVLAAAAALK
ncbi:MAG: peroxiredoxin [Verrucomicrobiales bacterium]